MTVAKTTKLTNAKAQAQHAALDAIIETAMTPEQERAIAEAYMQRMHEARMAKAKEVAANNWKPFAIGAAIAAVATIALS